MWHLYNLQINFEKEGISVEVIFSKCLPRRPVERKRPFVTKKKNIFPPSRR